MLQNNECFEDLVFKNLDKNPDKPEPAELEKYLALQENRKYLSDTKDIDKVLEEHCLNMLAEKIIMRPSILKELIK